jgi:hypothetical protein
MFRIRIKYLKLVSTIDVLEIDESKKIVDIKEYVKNKHTVLSEYNLMLIYMGKIHKDETVIRECLADDITVFITLLKSNSLRIDHDTNTATFMRDSTPSLQQTFQQLLQSVNSQLRNIPEVQRVNYDEKIRQLEDLGFTDRSRNIQLLQQYRGDINTVVNILMDE